MSIDVSKLKIIETLQDSERFLVQKAEHNNQHVVLKKAKSKKMIANLQSELLAYHLYGLLVKSGRCPFSIASVIDSGDDWILLSYLDGQPMNQLINEDNHLAYYGLLAEIMAFCDNKLKASLNGSDLRLPSFTERQYKERLVGIRRRFDLIEGLGIKFDVRLLVKAADIYEENIASLKTCFVNPDLTPSHIMIGEKNVSLFDFENAKLLGVRFSDLINMVTKIWFIEGDNVTAMNFYNSFWKHAGLSPDSFSKQLKTLTMQRCVGFTDELLTKPNQYHNTSQEMTQDFANNIASVFEWGSSV